MIVKQNKNEIKITVKSFMGKWLTYNYYITVCCRRGSEINQSRISKLAFFVTWAFLYSLHIKQQNKCQNDCTESVSSSILANIFTLFLHSSLHVSDTVIQQQQNNNYSFFREDGYKGDYSVIFFGWWCRRAGQTGREGEDFAVRLKHCCCSCAAGCWVVIA